VYWSFENVVKTLERQNKIEGNVKYMYSINDKRQSVEMPQDSVSLYFTRL